MINPIFFLFLIPGHPYVKAVEPSGCFFVSMTMTDETKGVLTSIAIFVVILLYRLITSSHRCIVMGKSGVFFTKIHVWEYPGTAYRE